jgi:hypothetical protein
MQMLGGVIPYIDFSNDITLIKDHRHELKKQKQETRKKKLAEAKIKAKQIKTEND